VIVLVTCLKEGKDEYLQLAYNEVEDKYYAVVKDKVHHLIWCSIELSAKTKTEAIRQAKNIRVF